MIRARSRQLSLFFFSGLSLFLVAGFPAHATKPPTTIFGKYVGFTTKHKSGAYRPTNSTDTVRISPSQTADAKVRVFIAVGQGQSCELEGDAVWENGQLTVTTDGLDDTKPCQLFIRMTGSTLVLQDAGSRCRDVYCGTRGSFTGAHFRKKP